MCGPAVLWKRSTREMGPIYVKRHQTNSSETQGWQQNDMSKQEQCNVCEDFARLIINSYT